MCHLRPRRSFHCQSTLPCNKFGPRARWSCWWLSKLFVLGLYLPPVFNKPLVPSPCPPQTIISLPVHTALCSHRAAGALVRLVAVQLSVLGLYLPPVFKENAAPDNHFSASPDGSVIRSGRGRIDGAGDPPLVCARSITRVGNFRQSVDNLP